MKIVEKCAKGITLELGNAYEWEDSCGEKALQASKNGLL